jgi:hypothetical protein
MRGLNRRRHLTSAGKIRIAHTVSEDLRRNTFGEYNV